VDISTGGEKRSEAEGVLNVSLTGRDPEEDQRLLEALSKTYLQAALQQRQQRLADGLAFLNKQGPLLEARTATVQGELAAFRERHNLLEPTEEGIALKQRVAELDTQVMGLEAERARLVKVRREIASGTLSARGFQEAISTGSGGTIGSGAESGLSVSDADQSLLQTRIANLSQQLTLLERDTRRYRGLAKGGATPTGDLDNREIKLIALRGDLAQARAQLTKVQADLQLSELRAPMAGTVLRITSRPGERPEATGIL
jgi:hypothetical protein